MAKNEKNPRHSPRAQSVMQDGKTDVKMPHKTTLKAMRDAEEARDLIQCEDSEDMFKKLEI